jgi:type III secretion system regulator LcrR
VVDCERDLYHDPQVLERHAQGNAAKDFIEANGPLLAVLATAGLAPRPATLEDREGSPVSAGHAVVLGRTEIVFRHLDPATLLLVRIRRVEAAPGLDSPLQGIARFVALLARTRAETGLERVVGVVDTSAYRRDGGLGDERLAAFYRRLHGAERLDPAAIPGLSGLDRELAGKDSVLWVGLELARFKGVRPRG